MNLGAISISPAVKDLEASEAFAGLGAQAPGRDRGAPPW